MAQRSRSLKAVMSFPSSRIVPLSTLPGYLSRPMMARAVMLLPQPDSPTIPTIDPAGTSRETSFTALATPFCVGKLAHRCSTCSVIFFFSPSISYPLIAHVRERSSGLSGFLCSRRIYCFFKCGSSTSRSPSPRKLKASTISIIAALGARLSHGALYRYWRPAFTIRPQEALGG